MDERLVACEEAVPPGEQVALEPALAQCARSGPPSPGRRATGGRRPAGSLAHPGPVGHLEHRLEPVRGGLVRAEDAEVAPVGVRGASRRAGTRRATRVASASSAPGSVDVDGVVAEVRQPQVAQQQRRRWRAGWRPCAARPPARAPASSGTQRRRRRRTAPRAGSCCIQRLEHGAGARGSVRSRRAAPGASATCPRPACRRPTRARSSPWACAARSSASAGASRCARARAAALDLGDLVEGRVERCAPSLVHRRAGRRPRRRSGS